MKLSSHRFALLAALAAFAAPIAAQSLEHAGAPATVAAEEKKVDFIMPHITDSHHLDIPFKGEVELPRWTPVHIGSFAIDISPTKHVVFLVLAALLVLLTMTLAAIGAKRQTREQGHTSGFTGMVETIVIYVRNEVVIPNVGPHGERFAPFVITLFFFILYANLLGLIPYGSTATGNISVTATLAIITFLVIEGATMAATGWRYIFTIFYWPHDMPFMVKIFMTFIMTPIEFISKLTKPFALAIRLFANMTAGHVVLLAMISLIFTFGSFAIAALPVGMGVAISMLELFVAFLQAFIFALLASVFIGLGRSGAH
jgi:F-type H+-transporting ATPase subunit a